ncbi:MAG: Glu/Leu/Phe/Val dehydrogenase dimerization domain-containing protein [Dehalococcoidia bacterium]
MTDFEKMLMECVESRQAFERMVIANDERTGLEVSVVMHDTTLGPALGGTRWHPFPTRTEALVDNQRLAKDMTYKLALAVGEDTELAQAGVSFGGGKAVIRGQPTKDKDRRKEQLRAYAALINSLAGKFVTSVDVGTSVEDMITMKEMTKWVAGLPKEMGGSGDPSPATAQGVVWGMKACLEAVFDTDSFQGKIVAIQGIAGKVGSILARDLAHQGAILIGSGGVNQSAAQKIATEIGAKLVPPDEIYEKQCDVFAACAMGGTLNDNTIPKLRCRITAGGANNQLWEPTRHAAMLQDRGILHAPAFWINAGGVINVAHELHPGGYSQERAFADIKKIYDRGRTIIDISRKEKVPPYAVAIRLAEDRIRKAKRTGCPATRK